MKKSYLTETEIYNKANQHFLSIGVNEKYNLLI